MANKPVSNYLEDILNNRDALVTQLHNKGQSAGNAEHFNTLVPKVGNINQREGIAYGETTFTSDSDVIEIKGIPFNPTKIGISCKAILNQIVFGGNVIYIALLSTSLVNPNPSIFEIDDPELTGLAPTDMDSITPNILVTLEEDGTYTVNISLATANASLTKKYMFKANFEYTWVVSGEEWFV